MKLPNQLSDSVRRLNPALITGASAPTVTAVSLLAQIAPSTDEQKLNKTERAYLNHLRALRPEWIGIQCITLKLADDTRYTPDFFMINNGVLDALEVKGFFRDDAKVKIKVAARQFPWVKFWLIFKTKNGWDTRHIRP